MFIFVYQIKHAMKEFKLIKIRPVKGKKPQDGEVYSAGPVVFLYLAGFVFGRSGDE